MRVPLQTGHSLLCQRATFTSTPSGRCCSHSTWSSSSVLPELTSSRTRKALSLFGTLRWKCASEPILGLVFTVLTLVMVSLHLGRPVQVKMEAIKVDTTNYEYEVLVDVIANIVLGAMPEVDVMARHTPPTPADNELDVSNLLERLPSRLREVWNLQRHLFALTGCTSASLQRQDLCPVATPCMMWLVCVQDE